MPKKIFSIYHLCLLVFFFTHSSSIAQMMPDAIELPDPLRKLEPSFYPVLKRPIKSFIYIIDKDTISKAYYDKNGNEHTKLDYENNKPFYKSLNKYNGSLKTETRFFIKDVLESTSTYKYDNNKNLVEWERIKTVYDKKASTSKQVSDIHWVLEFDKNNKVTKKFIVDALNVKNPAVEYFYDAPGKLAAAEEGQWKDKYGYDNGLLISKVRFFKPDNSEYARSDFKYNAEGLLVESSDKYYSGEFSYDSLKLKKAVYTYKKDKTYQEIDLSYNKGLLSKAAINTTALHLKAGFSFKTDYLYFSWSKTDPNKLSMEFLYDKYNNIIEIKHFIKGDYKYSKYFIYSYY